MHKQTPSTPDRNSKYGTKNNNKSRKDRRNDKNRTIQKQKTKTYNKKTN